MSDDAIRVPTDTRRGRTRTPPKSRSSEQYKRKRDYLAMCRRWQRDQIARAQ